MENEFCPMYIQWEKRYIDLDWNFYYILMIETQDVDWDLTDCWAFGC